MGRERGCEVAEIPVVVGSTGVASYHRWMPWNRRGTITLVVALGVLGAGACGPTDQVDRLEVRTVTDVAGEFGADIDRLIDDLGLTVETLSVRANRCDVSPEERHDVYYVWIGMRGAHVDRDVDRAIEQQHSRWTSSGWPITRFRQVDGGGVNLAATDPKTGAVYALDSGFDEDLDSYVVGTFNTVCFRDPSGAVNFGPLSS